MMFYHVILAIRVLLPLASFRQLPLLYILVAMTNSSAPLHINVLEQDSLIDEISVHYRLIR